MSNARHTPEVDALVQKHIDERTVMEAAGNWNHSHALRQVRELLALADSLETQRDAALERERGLREALTAMLYSAHEMEQAITPAGDKLEAVYPRGTLTQARAALSRAKGAE